jgi:class 3 adenylate cyclase/predicted ATPase
MSMPATIEEWLARFDLSRFATTFRDNGIDLDVVAQLGDDDLRELGLTIGDRKRVLAAVSASAAANPPAQAAAERRQLTVMFCDLADSTALSSRLDPEDMRDVIRAYQTACAAVVARYDGFVAKFMGDGLLAYFGYPRAHEDEAERAVRAGLEIVASVGGLQTPAREALQVRIGIATGLVVVGDLIGAGAAEEQSVVGETPNLAARLQALARPNAILIAEATRRQVGSLFEFMDLGPQPMKGLATPQPAWRVLGASDAANRFKALRSSATPLVGRDMEIALLMRGWASGKAGQGHAVLISAEPGLGKSRLAEAVRERIADEPHVTVRYFCSPHHRESAFYPIARQLERAAGFDCNDDAQVRRRKLKALLTGGPAEAELPLFAELLSVPGLEARWAQELTPESRKERMLDALVRLFEDLTRRRPVLAMFEDLHWMDPSSGELLDRVIARLDHMPGLLIATSRPEFQPNWTDRPRVSTLVLPRLGRRDAEALVRALAGAAPLVPDTLDEILERTDGVPLFLEEVTKAVLEAGGTTPPGAAAVPSGASGGARLAVPVSLQASLMARLDRLGPAAREVAQTASAIGRDFSYTLVAAAAPGGEAETRAYLDQLVAAGLVFQIGTPPAASYQFKHALVQDTAYSTLLRGPRQALHERLAAALEKRLRETGDGEPEILAHHFAEAGQPERAASYWLDAGRREAGRSANIEAIAHLQRGIDALVPVAETPSRLELELALQLALGPSLMANEGFSSAHGEAAYLRAQALAERLGDDRALFAAAWGRWMTTAQGPLNDKSVTDIVKELFRAAEQINDPGLRLQAHHAAWVTTLWLGDPAATHEHVSKGLALYDREKHGRHAVIYGGHDPAACGCGHDAIALWIMGYPDRAVASLHRGIAFANDLGHAPSVAHALWLASFVHMMRRDAPAALETAERLVTLGSEHELAVYRVAGRVLRGWARALLGAPEEGLAEMRAATDVYRSLAGVMTGPFLVALADQERRAGHFDRAEATLVQARAVITHRGEQLWVGGLLRSSGDLAASRPAPDLAETERLYEEARAIACRLGGKSVELRAARGLARLWLRQGKLREARDLLAPVFGWFTEGFDTPDLKETKALLEEINRRAASAPTTIDPRDITRDRAG